MSDLNIADYENVFDYSFDFNSIWVDKDLERKIRLCFNKLSNYIKLPEVYLIIYQLYLNDATWYLRGHFYFHWLEIYQLGEVLENKTRKLQKRRVTPIDLKIIHKIYTSLKQTYPDNFLINLNNIFSQIFLKIFSQESDFLKKSQLFKRLLSLVGLKLFFNFYACPNYVPDNS